MRRRKTSSTLPHISKSMPSDESKYEEAKEGADEVDIVKEGEWGESGSWFLQGRTKGKGGTFWGNGGSNAVYLLSSSC